jgi:hypothetical protein
MTSPDAAATARPAITSPDRATTHLGPARTTPGAAVIRLARPWPVTASVDAALTCLGRP